MGLISKLAGSADLVNGMADRVGLDLGEAVMRNPELVGPQYREMVVRCSTCTDQDACTQLQKSCDHLDAAPAYCRNKDIMDQGSR